jgi:hypothetical protein
MIRTEVKSHMCVNRPASSGRRSVFSQGTVLIRPLWATERASHDISRRVRYFQIVTSDVQDSVSEAVIKLARVQWSLCITSTMHEHASQSLTSSSFSSKQYALRQSALIALDTSLGTFCYTEELATSRLPGAKLHCLTKGQSIGLTVFNFCYLIALDAVSKQLLTLARC